MTDAVTVSAPSPDDGEEFVAAARLGIALTPAAAYTVSPGQAPNAVRVALASPPLAALTAALESLAGLARSSPDDLLGS